MNLENWSYQQHELLKTALSATDAYLGVEKLAKQHGASTNTMIRDFSYHMSRAHDALQALGVLDDHQEYMKFHVNEMIKLHNHDDSTLSDLPYAFVPKADYGEVDENKDQIKIKSFQDFLKENNEEVKIKDNEEKEEITEEEIEKIVDNLEWEDIVDFYSPEELSREDEEELEEEINEAISASSRLKRRQQFSRFKAKRNIAKGMKLRRASDPLTLQKRAKQAARRAIYKRFLKGRNKSQLSAAEKDRLESQVSRLKSVMSTIAQRMLPRIRSIEQKRLANQRTRK